MWTMARPREAEGSSDSITFCDVQIIIELKKGLRPRMPEIVLNILNGEKRDPSIVELVTLAGASRGQLDAREGDCFVWPQWNRRHTQKLAKE